MSAGPAAASPTGGRATPGRGGFSGVPLTAARGPTTKKALTIDWVYPVYLPETKAPEGRTSAAPVRRALEAAKAYEVLRAEDPRPLLVLREFSTFDDPSNEKLSRQLYTEATVTLSHWFRCVRLPHHVEEADHPFHALFASDDAPQLFLATPDGSQVWSFDYRASRADLAAVMLKVLDAAYTKNPETRCEQLVKMLSEFDRVDAQISRLKETLDEAIEDHGPRSTRARKAQKKLEDAQSDKAALVPKKKALEDIPLKAE